MSAHPSATTNDGVQSSSSDLEGTERESSPPHASIDYSSSLADDEEHGWGAGYPDLDPSDSASASAEFAAGSRPHSARPVRSGSRRHRISQRRTSHHFHAPHPPPMSVEPSEEYGPPYVAARYGPAPPPPGFYPRGPPNYPQSHAGGFGPPGHYGTQMVPYGAYPPNPFTPNGGYYPEHRSPYDGVPFHGNGYFPSHYALPSHVGQYLHSGPGGGPATEFAAGIPPSSNPEIEAMRLQLEKLKTENAAARNKKDSEDEVARHIKTMQKMQEESMKAAKEQFEAAQKAKEEERKRYEEDMKRERQAERDRVEKDYRDREERRKREEEERKLFEAEAKRKFEAEQREKEKAKEKAELEAKLEVERRKALEEKLKTEAETAAKKKVAEEKQKEEDDKKAAEAKKKEEEEFKKKALEEAKVKAAEVKKEKAPIKFKDAVGRKFSFPFHICQTWNGMEDLIKQAFLHVDVIGPHVQEGHYDLIGPNGEIILPSVWEKVIEPDWSVTMHMWPMDKFPLRHHGHGHMPGRPGGMPFPGGDPRAARAHAHMAGMRPGGAPRGGMPPPPPGFLRGMGPGGRMGPAAATVVLDAEPRRKDRKGGSSVLGWMAGKPSKSGSKKHK